MTIAGLRTVYGSITASGIAATATKPLSLTTWEGLWESMSLTGQIYQPTSPVRRWFNRNLNGPAAELFRQSIDNTLIAAPCISRAGSFNDIAGTAFDYAFRFWTGPQPLEKLAAGQGLRWYEHGEWALNIVKEAHDYIEKVHDQQTPDNLALTAYRMAAGCVILAHFEQLARGGQDTREIIPTFHVLNDFGTILHALNKPTVEDVATLLLASLNDWPFDRLSFICNPTFDSSDAVGGADADWIFTSGGDQIYYRRTLCECKCVKGMPFFRGGWLLQAIGYVLLDYSDQYELDSVAWYFPRQRRIFRYPLITLMSTLFKTYTDLTALRLSFDDAISSGDVGMTHLGRMSSVLDFLDLIADEEFYSDYAD